MVTRRVNPDSDGGREWTLTASRRAHPDSGEGWTLMSLRKVNPDNDKWGGP